MCANEITKPLSNIKSKIFPDAAKISLCTPLYKNHPNGNRHCISDYRSINICTGFSKILERKFHT